MPVIQKSPFAVMDRFPEHVEAIRQYFKADEAFRILCEDYRRSCEAVSYWSDCAAGAAATEAGERCREYAELKLELEAEILEQLAPSSIQLTQRSER